LNRILEHTGGIRLSRRYPGYLRVYNREYLLGLKRLLEKEAPILIEMLNLKETLVDLSIRVTNPEECSASGRLTRSILALSGAKSAMKENAEEFNLAAERYYRTTLKRLHIAEGLTFLREDFRRLDSHQVSLEQDFREMVSYIVTNDSTSHFLDNVNEDILNESASLQILKKFINLVLISVHYDSQEAR